MQQQHKLVTAHPLHALSRLLALPPLSCLHRYKNALEVAQLGPDLKILPAGDLTEIGDRGVTLSGGQVRPCEVAFETKQGF